MIDNCLNLKRAIKVVMDDCKTRYYIYHERQCEVQRRLLEIDCKDHEHGCCLKMIPHNECNRKQYEPMHNLVELVMSMVYKKSWWQHHDAEP